MYNLIFVAIDYSGEDLVHGLCGLFLAEVVFLNNPVKELSSSAEFSDNVEMPIILEELENLDDIRVVQFLQNFDLIPVKFERSGL